MKNISILFASLAAILCLAACNKEQDIATEDPQGEEFATITFTAEKADGDTKTAINVEGKSSVSYLWTDEDLENIRLYEVTKDGFTESLSSVTIKKKTLTDDKKTLTISATVSEAREYTFRAILANTMTETVPCVKKEQAPTDKSFDPTADVLVSDDMTVTVEEKTMTINHETVTVYSGANNLQMTFQHPVTINKMTLKNLEPGKAVQTVTITSDSKNLAGRVGAIISSSLSNYESNTITLSYGDGLTVPDTGDFPVYFVSLPSTGNSLTVTATTTDGTTFTKSFAEGKTIDFTAGHFSKFALAYPNAISISSVDYVASTDTYTINYSVSPATGMKVNASADVDWITDIDNSTAGVVTFKATGQDYEQAPTFNLPEAVVTLSLPATTSKTVRVSRASGPASFRYYFDNTSWAGDLYVCMADQDHQRNFTFSDNIHNNWNDVDYYWPSTQNYRTYNVALDGDDYLGVLLTYGGSSEDVKMGAKTKYGLTNISQVGIDAGRIYGKEDLSYVSLTLPNSYGGATFGWLADEVDSYNWSSISSMAYREYFKPGTDPRVQKCFYFSTGKVDEVFRDYAYVQFEASCRSGSICVHYVDVVADGYIIID